MPGPVAEPFRPSGDQAAWNRAGGRLFTHSGSWGNISCLVRRQTGTGEWENGQIVRRNAAWGG